MKRIAPRQWRLVLWVLLFLPYFKPIIFAIMDQFSVLDRIYMAWRLAAAGVVCGLYLLRLLKKKRLPSKILVAFSIFEGVLFVSTLVNSPGMIWEGVKQAATLVSFGMLIELALDDGAEMCLDMLVLPMTALVLINFVLLGLYPYGVTWGGTYGYSYNFLAMDNLLPPLLVPYMILVVLRSSLRHGSINWFAYSMLIVSSVSLLQVWSATGLIGMAVVLLFVLFFYERRLEKLFHFSTALGLSLLGFFGIVLFRLQSIFSFLIEGIFHKGLSFTGRTDIWDQAIRLFLSRPWLGYGIAETGHVYRLLKHKYYHAHNLVLEILVEGGVAGIFAFSYMILTAGRQLLLFRRHPYACLLSAGLLACGLMTSMEPFVNITGLLIYALVFLSYHIETLIAAGGVQAASEPAETA